MNPVYGNVVEKPVAEKSKRKGPSPDENIYLKVKNLTLDIAALVAVVLEAENTCRRQGKQSARLSAVHFVRGRAP